MWFKKRKPSVDDNLNAVDHSEKILSAAAEEYSTDITNHRRPSISSETREPVFSYDINNQQGVLRLRRGKWAGRTWTVRLQCCDNPLCACANVNFHCMDTDDADRNTQEHTEKIYFGLDANAHKATADTGRANLHYAPELAKAAVAEFGEQEWQLLYRFLLKTKRKSIRAMDVSKLTLPDLSAVLKGNGSLIGFAEIFPFADCFEFELNGELWAVDDQYCVMPDCDCREVVVNFLQLIPSQHQSVKLNKQIPAARYNYQRNKSEVQQKPGPEQPSLAALLKTLREVHPSFVEDVKCRHKQLKTIYQRSVLAQEPSDNYLGSGQTIRRDKPKAGRNDPCPCGSGKKYKKCCAR